MVTVVPRHSQRARPTREPGTLDRRKRRQVEIRERLYQSAIALFTAKGLQDTTVREITEAADVGKGTFFNYFPTKEHVLALFYERQNQRIEAGMRAVEEGHEPVRKALDDLARQATAVSPALVRSFLMAILSSEAVRGLVLPQLDVARQRLGLLLTIGQQRGEIRRDCPASELARQKQELIFGTALFWSFRPALPLDQLLASSHGLFCVPQGPTGTATSSKKGSGRQGRAIRVQVSDRPRTAQ